MVRHYTSRAGDPHRHLHLQINARVFAAGAWRGLHTVGVRDSHRGDQRHRPRRGRYATRSSGPRSPRTGSPSTRRPARSPSWRRTSGRSARGPRRSAATSTATRPSGAPSTPARSRARGCGGRGTGGPGRTPAPTRSSRPTAPSWSRAGTSELRDLGYRDPRQPGRVARTRRRWAGSTATRAVELVARPARARSGRRGTPPTSAARSRVLIAADRARRRRRRSGIELAEDLTARAVDACVPLLHAARCARARPVADLAAGARGRGRHRRPARATRSRGRPDRSRCRRTRADAARPDPAHAVVGALAGDGPAGGGRGRGRGRQDHHPRRRPRTLLAEQGHRLLVVTPTLKAAEVAAARGRRRRALGRLAGPPARLPLGRRRPLDPATDRRPGPRRRLRPGDLLLVDEAGMLDQDTARALLTIADETGARVALVGDRHQLPAVGRGGVLDHAARWAHPTAVRRPGRRCTGSPTPSTPHSQPADAHRRRPRARCSTRCIAAARSSSTPARSNAPPSLADAGASRATWSSPTPASRSPRSTPRSATGARRRPVDDTGVGGHRRAGSGSGSGTGSRPAATTATSASRTARPGPSPASATTAASSSTADGPRTAQRPGRRTPREHVELAYATTVHGAQGETVDRAARR